MINPIATTYTIQSINKKLLLIRCLDSTKKCNYMKNSKLKWDNNLNGWLVSTDASFNIIEAHLKYLEENPQDVEIMPNIYDIKEKMPDILDVPDKQLEAYFCKLFHIVSEKHIPYSEFKKLLELSGFNLPNPSIQYLIDTLDLTPAEPVYVNDLLPNIVKLLKNWFKLRDSEIISPVSNNNSSPDPSPDQNPNFSNMSFRRYGKGYLLEPNEGNKHPDWGLCGTKETDYYYGGWWMPNHNGWFFRSNKLNILIENGAVSKEQINISVTKSPDLSPNKNTPKFKPFYNMNYMKYGNGYLLKPNDGQDHPDWGFIGTKNTDYYYGGWWRNDLDGWFFRGSKSDVLNNNGAVFINEIIDKQVKEKKSKSNISKKVEKKIANKIKKSSKDTSINKKIKSSINKDNKFKKPVIVYLPQKNVIKPISPVTEIKSTQTKSDQLIFDNMSYSKYGNGYLLIPNNGKNHPDWGKCGTKKTNYYNGGWWREDLNGWFFRGNMLNTLEENGAKLCMDSENYDIV